MKQFILWNIVLTVVVGFLGPWSTMGTSVETSSLEQRSDETRGIAEDKLKAFAHAYVALRKVAVEYGPSLREAKNVEEVQKIQQEAASNMEETLRAHGFTPRSFQSVFKLVNANDELRSKVLKLIDQERGKVWSGILLPINKEGDIHKPDAL